MARKSTKKSSKQASENSERNRKIALGGAIVVGAAAVFVGAAMGVGELDRQAAEFIAPGALAVEINWPINPQGESWMPINERERIELLLKRSVQGGQALSRAPLEEAGLALAGTGWVDGLPTVRWTSDGAVSVHADWRIPAGAVRVGTREFIIDWDRRVLPLDYAFGESNQFYFLNAGAQLPSVGEQWVGTDLEDGLVLLGRLEQEGLLEQVGGFDLGEGSESGIIRILTKRGGQIIWGAGPGRELPGEVPTGVKIDRLKVLYDKSGQIDGGSVYIDITGSTIMFKSRGG